MPRSRTARGRTLLASAICVALTMAALASPVSAANPTLAIVNGIPGRTVDVCIGAKEVRSGLRYGKWFERRVSPGEKRIRLRAAVPGTCSGRLLAAGNVAVTGDDLTIVGTSKGPGKLMVFSNASISPPAAVFAFTWYAVRHAADLGEVTFRVTDDLLPLSPAATPAVDPVWDKGDERTGSAEGDGLIAVAATRPGSQRPLAAAVVEHGGTEGYSRLQLILVGSAPKNARIVTLLQRLVVAP
jgi:hypothetical protein